jgi:hypothetical protein
MHFVLLTVVALLLLAFLAALVLCARSFMARVIASILALGFAGLCAFGFLASFEPSDAPRWPWQIAYGILGLGSLITTVLLLGKGSLGRNALPPRG